MAVVEQAIEDGGRHDRIAEDGAPFADRAVRGDQHAAAFVTARDELEEEMRRIGLEWQQFKISIHYQRFYDLVKAMRANKDATTPAF